MAEMSDRIDCAASRHPIAVASSVDRRGERVEDPRVGTSEGAHGRTPGVEIERRWLLDGMPSAAELSALDGQPVAIEQVYLTGTGGAAARRVRRVLRPSAEAAEFVLTVKRGKGIRREETSTVIDGDDYERLVATEADPARHPILKTRHEIRHGRHLIELDQFAEPAGIVLLEVELTDPDEAIDPWPTAIARRIVREVTDDPAYLNANLALRDAHPNARA